MATGNGDSVISSASLLTYAMPAIVAAMTLVPAATIVIDGRDIGSEHFFDTVDATGLSLSLLRFFTLGTVIVSLAVLAARLISPAQGRLPGAVVLFGFSAFFFSSVILSDVFGTVPDFDHKQLYPLLVLGAIYVSRRWTRRTLPLAVKAGLLTMILASLVAAFVDPRATLSFYAPELRLPYVPFRFWGLGNTSNSIGPLALLLLLLTIDQPFQRSWLTLTSLTSAAIVIVLAQSQTTWVATALVVPGLLLYRRALSSPGSHWFESSPPLPVTVLTLMLAAVAVVTIVGTFDIEEIVLSNADEILTGRGKIWQVALQMYHENPLFGYGPTAWDDDFRALIGMSYAFHAHNQFLQSLSVAGLVGLSGLLIYLGTLVFAALRMARPTRGLAPAVLFGLFLARMITEAPFAVDTVLADVFVAHITLFHLLVSGPTAASSIPVSACPTSSPRYFDNCGPLWGRAP